MEKNKNYIMISVANKIKFFSIIFFAPCVWVGFLAVMAGEVYRLSNIFILIFADIIVYCIMDFWIKWIVLEKCDVQAQEKFELSLLKQKRYKESVNSHLELLVDSLILGKYDESRQEIDELHRLDSRMKLAQRLEFQLHNIDYMIAVTDTESLNAELENAENTILELSGKNDRIKQICEIRLMRRQYLIEERWEDLRVILEETRKKDTAILEQVFNAFDYGQCCYHLGRYEEAYHELKFAARYGGNTKYVALANDLMEKIPEKNLYESKISEQSIKAKLRINKTVIILAISCLLLILSIGFNRYLTHGNSIEEAYCRRYFCEQDELTIIYQKEIDNYELVILCEEGNAKNVGYCLFEETDSDCKIVASFRYDRTSEMNYMRYMRSEMNEREKEFYRKNTTSGEIWLVFTDFYKKNNIFNQEDMVYVGICSFPMAEDIVVNGSPVSIEQVIYIDDAAVYLWSVENVDLKTSLKVEYVAE